MKDQNLESIIRGLMNHEGRPANVGPAEMMAIIALVVKGAIEKPVPSSRFTLSLEIGASDKTAERTLEKLHADIGWLSKVSGKGRSNANRFTVMLDRLPVPEQVKKTIITEPMRQLAHQYCAVIKPYGSKGKRRFTKAVKQRMSFCLQRLLDRQCGGDEQLLRKAIKFALDDPRYRRKAFKGPHMLRREFLQIVAEVKTQEQPPAQSEAA